MPRPRLLVVDDNLELLSLLTHLFEDAGYDVVSASKAKQALDVARATRRPWPCSTCCSRT